MTTKTQSRTTWHREITRTQWLVLAGTTLGWGLDAARGGLGLCRFECGFQRGGGNEREQRRRHSASMCPCLVESGAGAGQRLGQSAEFLAGGLRLMLGRGDLIARAVELGMRLLCLLAQRLGLEPRRFRLGNGGGKLGVGLGGAALRLGGLSSRARQAGSARSAARPRHSPCRPGGCSRPSARGRRSWKPASARA